MLVFAAGVAWIGCGGPAEVAIPGGNEPDPAPPIEQPEACVAEGTEQLCPELPAWQDSPSSPCVRNGLDACAVTLDVPPTCFAVAPCEGGMATIACCSPEGESFLYACHEGDTGEGCPPYECLLPSCKGERCAYSPKAEGAPCLGDGSAPHACFAGLCQKL